MAAHIPLDTQNNGTGRSILGHYVGFSEDHRGGILVLNPKTRTTTVRHTYKALGLVEEQRLDDIIYVIDSASPITMTPAQTEQTQFIVLPPTPLPTRSSSPPTHNPSFSKLTSDRFILDEVIRHVQTPHSSSLSQQDLSQPIVQDGYHYKRISPHKCPKSVKPFLRYVDRDFRDTSARTFSYYGCLPGHTK